MNDKIKALVLNVSDYRENDLLLQVISEDKGFLTLSGKSAKKMSAKQHFSSLCVYEFIIDYKDNKTMYSIHGSKLIESFYEDKDLNLLSFKNVLTELTLKAKGDYDSNLYKNITFALRETNTSNMYLLGSLFVAYLLKLFGISPSVDRCVVCGSQKVVSISNKLGGFLCNEHLGQEEILEVERLKKFRLINKADFDKYEQIKDIVYDYKDFNTMMNFYSENSDNYIKSYKLFKDLFVCEL